MKKIIIPIIAMAMAFITGCDMNESATISTANTAGNLTMLTWFSIDNPDCEVKAVLKEVIGKVTSASVSVGEGNTYLDSVLPEIQNLAIGKDNLTDYQKTLISSGSVIILNGIDTFLASNEKVKGNAELVSKIVGAFGKGCLTVLNMKDDCCEIRKARAVYNIRSMKCRDGKFTMD